MASRLFHALRDLLGEASMPAPQLSGPDGLDDDSDAVYRHVGLMSLLCCQLLYHLGDPEDDEQQEEIHALVSMIDIMLLRLHHGTLPSDTPTVRTIREIHSRLLDLTR